MLKVYYHPLSTFSQRVRIALIEKTIPAELVEVDLLARAQFQPEYLSKNPYGRVPAIDDDGWVLYESTAILEYLEATGPTPPLLPRDARDRARVSMHMKLCDLEFAGPARTILLPKRFLPKERWILEPMEKARANLPAVRPGRHRHGGREENGRRGDHAQAPKRDHRLERLREYALHVDPSLASANDHPSVPEMPVLTLDVARGGESLGARRGTAGARERLVGFEAASSRPGTGDERPRIHGPRLAGRNQRAILNGAAKIGPPVPPTLTTRNSYAPGASPSVGTERMTAPCGESM